MEEVEIKVTQLTIEQRFNHQEVQTTRRLSKGKI